MSHLVPKMFPSTFVPSRPLESSENSPKHSTDRLLTTLHGVFGTFSLIMSWAGVEVTALGNIPETMVMVIFLEEATCYCRSYLQCSVIQAWDSNSGSAAYQLGK